MGILDEIPTIKEKGYSIVLDGVVLDDKVNEDLFNLFQNVTSLINVKTYTKTPKNDSNSLKMARGKQTILVRILEDLIATKDGKEYLKIMEKAYKDTTSSLSKKPKATKKPKAKKPKKVVEIVDDSSSEEEEDPTSLLIINKDN